MMTSRLAFFPSLCIVLVSCSLFALGASATTRSVSFGDVGAGAGWQDLGLVNQGGGIQVASYIDTQATPSGDVVFALTAMGSNNLGVNNGNLLIRNGSFNGRIDSRDFTDPSDDEWVRFQLSVGGPGAVDLSELSFAGITLLNAADGDLVEFEDGTGTTVQLQNPGGAVLSLGGAEALDGLEPLSLVNVGGFGDSTWRLKLTARAFGTSSTTGFRIARFNLNYTVATPAAAPELISNGMVLHLDAGTVSGVSDGAALIAGWQDISASGAVANSPVPPVYLADGGGGYPAVRFNGVDQHLEANVSTGNQVSVFIVFAHQRATSLTDYRDILITGAGGGNNLSLASSRSSVTAPDYPSFDALSAAGLDFQTWVNGHNTADVSGDLFRGRYTIGSAVYTSAPSETILRIGAESTGGSNAGQNDIRELIVYDRALTEAERLEVQSYLAKKYKISAVTRGLDHPIESYPHVLGSQQFGDQYSFGESGIYALDYARQAVRQGNRVVKFRLSDRFDQTNNGDGFSQDNSIDSLVKLVRDHPEVKEIFDLPLTDYLFWVSTFSVPKWQDKARTVGTVAETSWTNFYGANRPLYPADTYTDPLKAPSPYQGLNPADAQKIYDEIYDLTVYLLQTYSGSGKSFYIGNWEGDWMLSSIGDYVDQNILPERLQAMIDWSIIRQEAIDDAKAATAHSDVNVWFYLEGNKMDWARDGQICVANTVIPAMPKLDFISFSAYSIHKTNGFTADESRMHSDLDILQALIDAKPDPSISGSRLIIGEYGFQFGNTGRFADFTAHAQEHVASARNFFSWQGGTLRFLLQWQFYSRQVTDAGVPYEMCQIDQQGALRPLYYMHENFYSGMREWLEGYYAIKGSLPMDREYADEAYRQLGGISLAEHVSDLSNPWPGRVELQGGRRTVVIPDTVDGVIVDAHQATVYSRFGRIMPNEPVSWTVAPDQQGVSVDANGSVSVPGNASPDAYTVTAGVDAYPLVFGSNALQAVLPVASIYDQLSDFSKADGVAPALSIAADNAVSRFEGDAGRASRLSSTSPEAISWHVPNLNRFYVKVYSFGALASNLAAEISTDGVSWQAIALRVDPGVPTADNWQRSWAAPLSPLPVGTNYFRLLLQDPLNAWNPQLAAVVLFGADTGFNFWKSQAFTEPADLSDPAISGPSADPMQSGIPNLYRYFAGLPLEVADLSDLPRMQTVAGDQYYGIPFDPMKLDVRAQIKGSLDLQSWDYTLFDSVVDAAVLEDGWLWIHADNLPVSDEKFFKLELSL